MKLNTEQYNTLKNTGLNAEYYGSDDSPMIPFGEACYNDNCADDLINYKTAEPDNADMENWGIDEQEWRNGQKEALQLAMWFYEDETL